MATRFPKASPVFSRAQFAYRRASRKAKRFSSYVNEEVEVHPDETAAIRGEYPPRRFRWRERWHRVQDVTAIWRDTRKTGRGSTSIGRTFFYVSAGPIGFFQMYFEKRWMLYKKVEFR